LHFTPDPTDDPNEAYEVAPRPAEPHGPVGWWDVLCNGVRVYSGPDRSEMERLATDPAARQAIYKPPVIKLWDRKS
jgi:hypothetical protein